MSEDGEKFFYDEYPYCKCQKSPGLCKCLDMVDRIMYMEESFEKEKH